MAIYNLFFFCKFNHLGQKTNFSLDYVKETETEVHEHTSTKPIAFFAL